MTAGRNTKAHIETQIEFAAYIRNPEINPAPEGIEPRRMKVYADLFFNNIKNFLSTTFPIAKSCLGQETWLVLCREFLHQHPSDSPYFAEISQEFLTFLQNRKAREDNPDPDWLLELCHYEWVELSLDLEADDSGAKPVGNEVLGDIRLSFEARCLSYGYPVHEIGPEHQPEEPKPVHLLVYRKQDEVHFLEVNIATMRMLQLLESRSGEGALAQVAEELREGGRTQAADSVASEGLGQLSKFADLGILRVR